MEFVTKNLAIARWEKNIDLYNQLGDLLVGVACDIYHSLVLEISQVVDEYEEVC